MRQLLQLPFIVSVIIIYSLCSAVFLSIFKLIRKKIPHENLRENHHVAGYLYNAICFIYAVLIAFVVYVSWDNLNDTNVRIEQESNHLLNLYYSASAYPDSIRSEIESTIHDYVIKVTNNEWASMVDGNRDMDAAKAFIKLNKIFLSVKINDSYFISIQSESLKNLNELGEFRRHRLLSSRMNIPYILWSVLITCSVILVVFTFFFGTRSIRLQYFMTSLLLFICVLMLWLIYVLDHPFIGLYRISTEAFEPVLSYIKDFGGN